MRFKSFHYFSAIALLLLLSACGAKQQQQQQGPPPAIPVATDTVETTAALYYD